MCIFVPLMFVKPYKLHYFFMASFFAVVTTILGMFIWAISANHGAGDLVAPIKKLSTGYVPKLSKPQKGKQNTNF